MRRQSIADAAIIAITSWLVAMLAYVAVMSHFAWDSPPPPLPGYVVGAGEAP